jgi:hypothetical protein
VCAAFRTWARTFSGRGRRLAIAPPVFNGKSPEMRETAARRDVRDRILAVNFCQFGSHDVEAEPMQIGKRGDTKKSLKLFVERAFGYGAGGRQPRESDLLLAAARIRV